jgi:hypothetical protein
MATDTEARAAEPEAPTAELLAGTVGDRCANCHAPLAADQRYCLECGTRRGKPRFSYAEMAAQASAAATVATGAVPPPPRTRWSSGATLVAGVATLLIAMGVGVLIGHTNNTNTASKGPAVQVVTVGGGGAAATTSASNATAAAKSSGHRKGKVKRVVVHLTAKTQAKAAAAARQVIGAGAPKNPTIQPGQACSPGQAGCAGGKFTGSFFSGG